VVSLSRVGAFATALGPDFEVDQIMLHDALTTGRSANIFFMSFVTKVECEEPNRRNTRCHSLYFEVWRHSRRCWIGREAGSKPLGQSTGSAAHLSRWRIAPVHELCYRA
jgi:hypothetical protein